LLFSRKEGKMIAGMIGITVLLVIIALATNVTFVGAQQAKTFLKHNDPTGRFTINYPNDWIVKPGNRFEKFLVDFNGPSASFRITEPIIRHNDPNFEYCRMNEYVGFFVKYSTYSLSY
jgi:hypothetical protein